MATTISDRISEALVDDRLSTSARGLFGYLALRYADENLPAAMALTTEYPMGRDRIRKAMNELIDTGYLERDNYRQRNGQMIKVTRVSAGHTEAWFSGHLPVVTTNSSTDSGSTTTDDLLETSASTSHNDNSSVANAPSELCATASPRAESARDLAREFHALVTTRTQAIGQVNFGALASNIARWRREGATPEAIRHAMEIFFDDPRNVAKAGRGLHLWKAFVAWYPQNQGLVADLAHDPWEEINNRIETDGVLLTRKRF